MDQRELLQRVTAFMLVTSFLVGCTVFEAAPASTRTAVLTLTKERTPITTPTSTPGNDPSPTDTPTPDPCTGWWCTAAGVVYADAAESGNELQGVSVTLSHFSYCSPTSGQFQTTTEFDGSFEFRDVFFHDTDRIRIQVESGSYEAVLWDSIDRYCLYCSCFGSPIEIILRNAPVQ